MSAILAIPVLLLNIAGFLIFPAVKYRIQVQKSPLIGFSSLFLVMYFFVIFGIGKIGIYFTIFVNASLLIYSLFLIIRKNTRPNFFNTLLPLLIIFVIFFLVGIFVRNRFYYGWDELAFWDAFVRSLFVTGERSTKIVHADYPLGISLIQYYFVSITKYSQGIIIFGILSVLFSAVLACCPNLTKKNLWTISIIIIFSVLTLYLCNFEAIAIRVDGLMGIFFAALVFLIITEEKFDRLFSIQLSILLFFFISLKTPCLIFVAILIFLLFSRKDLFSELRKSRTSESPLKGLFSSSSIRNLLIIIAGPAIAFISWEVRNQIVQPMKIFSTTRFTLQNIQLLFSPEIADRERQICLDGLEHIFEINFFNAKIPVYLIAAGLFFLALFIDLLLKTTNSRKFLITNAILLIGFIGYTFFQFLFALFIQEPDLGEELNSFDRYIGTYIVAWLLSFFSILLWMIRKSTSIISKQILSIISMVVFFYVLSVAPMKQIFSPPLQEKTMWVQQKKVYKQFVNTIPKGSIVQTIDLESSGLSCLILNNLFVGHSYFIWDPCSNPKDFEISKEEFADYIDQSEADYILIEHGNEHFWNEFSEMFDFPWHGQIFKVVGRGDYRRVLPDE
jgi:hypothetical protein